jgi:hypothetical protein
MLTASILSAIGCVAAAVTALVVVMMRRPPLGSTIMRVVVTWRNLAQ